MSKSWKKILPTNKKAIILLLSFFENNKDKGKKSCKKIRKNVGAEKWPSGGRAK